jgi:hypothetical protein
LRIFNEKKVMKKVFEFKKCEATEKWKGLYVMRSFTICTTCKQFNQEVTADRDMEEIPRENSASLTR